MVIVCGRIKMSQVHAREFWSAANNLNSSQGINNELAAMTRIVNVRDLEIEQIPLEDASKQVARAEFTAVAYTLGLSAGLAGAADGSGGVVAGAKRIGGMVKGSEPGAGRHGGSEE